MAPEYPGLTYPEALDLIAGAGRVECDILNLLHIPKQVAVSLLSNLPLWLQFRLGYRTSASLDNDVSYAIAVACDHLRLLADRNIDLPGAHILELGPGLDLAPQLALASHGAHVTVADRFLARWDDAYHPEFYRRFRARWTGPAAAIDAVINAGGYPPDVISCVAEPAEILTGVPSASCDVVLSNAVLEHVYDLPAVCRTLARVTRPRGLGMHQIDFRDHRDFQRPLEFLLYDSQGYHRQMTRGRVARGNRHRLADHVSLFREAGFRIENVDPNTVADQTYLDAFVPRLRASSSVYRDRAQEDLVVLSARITMVR